MCVMSSFSSHFKHRPGVNHDNFQAQPKPKLADLALFPFDTANVGNVGASLSNDPLVELIMVKF